GPTSAAFVSRASLEDGSVGSYDLRKQIVPVSGCRTVTKQDMIFNDATPDIEVDPETYEVTADGQSLKCEPAQTLPLAQKYFVF
ncbi:MAG: urease subunit alpha, partial [Pirellulales bacterium]